MKENIELYSNPKQVLKNAKRIYGNDVDIDYSIDSGITWTNIETSALGSEYPEDYAPDILYFDVLSSKIRFRFRNSTLAETFYLKQFMMCSQPKQ